MLNINSPVLLIIDYVPAMYQAPLLVEHTLGSWFHSLALTEGNCVASQSVVLKATPAEQLSWDSKSPTYS